MSAAVVIRRLAGDDIAEAQRWYEARQRGLGQDFLTHVEAAVASAAQHPERYPVVLGTIRRVLLKRFPFGLYYRIRTDAIVVIAVVHGRRDPATWQGRR